MLLTEIYLKLFGLKEIIQVTDSIPWVRCASGNVFLLYHSLVNSVFMCGITLFCFTPLWATSFVALHKLQFSLLNLTTSCTPNIQSYQKKLKQKCDLYGKGSPLTWTFHFAISTFQPYMLNCICNTRQTLELYAFGSFPEFQCLKFIQDINGPCD